MGVPAAIPSQSPAGWFGAHPRARRPPSPADAAESVLNDANAEGRHQPCLDPAELSMNELVLPTAGKWCRPRLDTNTDTMLAPAETVSPAAPSSALYLDPPTLRRSTLSTGLAPQQSFKKHKVLPHPRHAAVPAPSSLGTCGPPLSIDTTLSSTSAPASGTDSRPATDAHSSHPGPNSLPPTQVENSKVGGPDLPPTPPAHSQTPSSGPSAQSAQPSTPTYVESPASNPDTSRTPGTPPNQRSPPTPDVTPPQPTRRPRPSRPSVADRIPSKATNESRSASFTTARETPYSSGDERAAVRPAMSSSNTSSQNTVRPIAETKQRGVGLGLDPDTCLTPRTKQEFTAFDGGWESGNEAETEWDPYLFRNVTVRKRQTPLKADDEDSSETGRAIEVLEDDPVTPAQATQALRAMPLKERLCATSSPSRGASARANIKRVAAPSASETSTAVDDKRFSTVSSKSTASTTVVEAILVDTPPPRRKTLRHVKKHMTLRDPGSSGSELSRSSFTTTATGTELLSKRPLPRGRVDGERTESLASTATLNSLASRKGRRDVWKSGAVPVIVIPDRRASVKGTNATPSLRSTSSRKSQRSNSLSSAPLSTLSKSKDLTPYFERPSRRERSVSESDGSLPGDQRTIDYPPIVPVRTSSLSASTSRHGSAAGSRAGSRPASRSGSRSASLTAESLQAHNTLLLEQQREKQQTKPPAPKIHVQPSPSVEYIPPEPGRLEERRARPAPSIESHREAAHDHRPLVDHNGDPFFGKRLTTHNTPFSQASVETNGTHSAAEVSEALAVNIYPHQNRSLLVVDHTSTKNPDINASSTDATTGDARPTIENPQLIATGPDGGPVTPPQPRFSAEDVDVDSPLRNPRAPPEPPVIKFIPATPSGLTPAAEKMKLMGNYFEETTEKRPSMIKRAFSLRKTPDNSAPRSSGFLTRTLSLTRAMRKDTAEDVAPAEYDDDPSLRLYPTEDEPPPDEERLHPYWRPSSSQIDFDGDEDFVYDVPEDAAGSRPTLRRSLSARMKRTFAILPVAEDGHYKGVDSRSPERRTIRRTPSGNLRVMRRRDSYNSIRDVLRPSLSLMRRSSQDGRPSTAPNQAIRPARRTWGTEKRYDSQGRRFFPGWQEKLYGLQGLGRRLSEHRRQKRSDALRGKISGPREVRDGVGDVIKRKSYRGPSCQSGPQLDNSAYNAEQRPATRGTERSRGVQTQV